MPEEKLGDLRDVDFLSDQERFVIVDRRLDGSLKICQRPLAVTDDSVIGSHLHDDEISPDRVHEVNGDVLDLQVTSFPRRMRYIGLEGIWPQSINHDSISHWLRNRDNFSTNVKNNVLQSIGDTPLVKLNKMTGRVDANVFVKLEFFNPTGSYKDRMALAMIEGAERQGLLKPGDTVIEYTGGSTGTSLAFVCAVKDYKLKIVTSDAFSEEKRNTMKAFGADLTIVPSEGGQITPDLVPRMMKVAEEMGREPHTYRTNQFYNENTLKGYNKIGTEILDQLMVMWMRS